MIVLPPQELLEHFGVFVAAITGVLAARGKRVDLFGVLVLALVTAFGGGTVRDNNATVSCWRARAWAHQPARNGSPGYLSSGPRTRGAHTRFQSGPPRRSASPPPGC